MSSESTDAGQKIIEHLNKNFNNFSEIVRCSDNRIFILAMDKASRREISVFEYKTIVDILDKKYMFIDNN